MILKMKNNGKKTSVAKAEMLRLAKRAGASRVSEDATVALGEAVEDFVTVLVRKSLTYTAIGNHPKTLKAIDVRSALKQ